MNKNEQLENINRHIKLLETECQSTQNRILNSEKMDPGELRLLRKTQDENQLVLYWLINIKADAFKTLPATNGGIIHGR
jgi:hypothetical protein